MLLDNNKKTKLIENEKTYFQTYFERLHCVVFQFSMQKYYTWQNNTS